MAHTGSHATRAGAVTCTHTQQLAYQSWAESTALRWGSRPFRSWRTSQRRCVQNHSPGTMLRPSHVPQEPAQERGAAARCRSRRHPSSHGHQGAEQRSSTDRSTPSLRTAISVGRHRQEPHPPGDGRSERKCDGCTDREQRLVRDECNGQGGTPPRNDAAEPARLRLRSRTRRVLCGALSSRLLRRRVAVRRQESHLGKVTRDV